ncbi:hypothetical protein M3O96_04525 [Aquiflexum sp. TKW24L]|uniref:hypothetical protein n=1 Tax=Aquiflexum sp. TKW24L TaxID=2942212 RepID=UPI0020C04A66|nr:hypothetical protein [Aquiflexum sp. TKW24L]MCL6258339.1 hypothetical protein [Aquiflexum sp. TKW24L]
MKRTIAASSLELIILATESISIRNFELNACKHQEAKEVLFHANSLERQFYN